MARRKPDVVRHSAIPSFRHSSPTFHSSSGAFCAWCACDPGDQRGFPAIGIALDGTETLIERDVIVVLPLDGRRAAVGYRIRPRMPFSELGIDVLFPLCSTTCADELDEALRRWRTGRQMH